MTNNVRTEALAEKLAMVSSAAPDVNYGGCGIVAQELYDRLAAAGESPKVAVFCEEGYAPDGRLGFDKMYKKRPWSHIVIDLDGALVDGTGRAERSPMRERFPAVAHVAKEDLDRLVADESAWNPRFERNRHERAVRELVAAAVIAAAVIAAAPD